MDYSKAELAEAKRQIDSLLHKLRATKVTLEAKENPERYKSQITLAARRIDALELANTLIGHELEKVVDEQTYPSTSTNPWRLQELDTKSRKGLIQDLVMLWRASVEATHTFLTCEDIKRIEGYVPQALESVEHLVVAWDPENTPLGFIGAAGQKIEMLFLHPAARGQGLRRCLVEHARERYNASEVDVNEQNDQACAFYEHMGFAVVSRSETDDAGDPFPILHMRLV